MEILTSGTDIDAFFGQLACSEDRLLMLDYDGTLSPYHVERHEAVPYPGVREILVNALSATDCRTVIVSGRAISDLLPLLAIERGMEIWGCHGWERLGADGDYTAPALERNVSEGLNKASALVVTEGFEESLEIKPASVALHWRGLDDRTASTLKTDIGGKWKRIAEDRNLELHSFNGGIELRPAGMDKGVVVDRLLSGSVGAAAFLGDDITDEDAFRAISGRGIGILISTSPKETAADVRLVPPDEMLWFLERWIESCGKKDG